jgi:hypothetical protein
MSARYKFQFSGAVSKRGGFSSIETRLTPSHTTARFAHTPELGICCEIDLQLNNWINQINNMVH